MCNKLCTKFEIVVREHLPKFLVIIVRSVGTRILQVVEPEALDKLLHPPPHRL